MSEEHEAEEGLENTTMRDALEAAYEEAEAPEGVEDTTESVPAAEEGRARDEHGRFASKEEAPEAVHAETQPAPDAGEPAVEADEQQPEQPPQVERAPQSWKPAAREHWASLPPDVRAEIHRREHDVQQAFNQTAEERKLASAFKQVYAPYEAMIRGEGSDPIRAFDHLLQTSYQLRTAPPQQKAELVAGLIQQFGIDVRALDNVLTRQIGGMPRQPQQQQPMAPQADPRVDQIMQALSNMHQQNAAQRQEKANAEVASFAQSHEFLDDVRDYMADLIEVAANRGVDLSMEDAYNQACRANPEIAKVLDQRQRATAAGQSQQRARQARTASSSVRGNPKGAAPRASGAVPLRDAIEAAMDDAAG